MAIPQEFLEEMNYKENNAGIAGASMGSMDFSSATIGVNHGSVEAFIERIRTDVIEEAIRLLSSEEEALFNVFRANWKGQAEINFESQMIDSRKDIATALGKHADTLAYKIREINNAWVAQDEEMIGGIK